MAFMSAADAFSFFDLNGNENLRLDEFMFGVQFFVSASAEKSRLVETMMLFNDLDLRQDGVLDVDEFEQLFFSTD